MVFPIEAVTSKSRARFQIYWPWAEKEQNPLKKSEFLSMGFPYEKK